MSDWLLNRATSVLEAPFVTAREENAVTLLYEKAENGRHLLASLRTALAVVKKRSGQRCLYPPKVISGNQKSSSARTHNAEARAEAGGVSAVSFPVE